MMIDRGNRLFSTCHIFTSITSCRYGWGSFGLHQSLQMF
jgi:hypothetical protein